MSNTISSVYLAPSYYTLIATGIATLFILIGYFRGIELAQLTFLTLFAILIGIHGMLHHQMETTYHYNPLSKIYT